MTQTHDGEVRELDGFDELCDFSSHFVVFVVGMRKAADAVR